MSYFVIDKKWDYFVIWFETMGKFVVQVFCAPGYFCVHLKCRGVGERLSHPNGETGREREREKERREETQSDGLRDRTEAGRPTDGVSLSIGFSILKTFLGMQRIHTLEKRKKKCFCSCRSQHIRRGGQIKS